MNANRTGPIRTIALTLTLSTPLVAGTYDVSWRTNDAGGGYSAGGAFEVEGTVGQHDTGYSAGGVFEMEGGFWAGAATTACACPGDVNHDGTLDGADIQQFVSCLLGDGACGCADVDGMNSVGLADVGSFIAALTSGQACP
ncbi:MAG TPA: hypothetical protein P5081_09370 [Phycisphaerae bacterium]|nr:hypothetical protein [Phycisphaerae bacterium]HRW53087.1 hypothetical protein [Phycisphaerae bacterium]